MAGHAYEQKTPRHGWSQQNPRAWWEGVTATLRQVLNMPGADPGSLVGLAVCGQMHSPVPIDAEGRVLAEWVQLWNDRRCADLAATFARRPDAAEYLHRAGSPPTTAWSGFKAAWLRVHQPQVYKRTATFLSPKDFINFKLAGVRATDYTEASGSFLLDWRTLDYDAGLADALDLDRGKFPSIYPSHQVIGTVTRAAAVETGLPMGLPVVAGGGDAPVALLGAGVIEPGTGVDITGTSTVIGALSPAPILASGIANFHAVCGGWMPFTVLDAAGDSVRWARSLLNDTKLDFRAIVDLAATAPAGAGGLLFMPYLNGERLGEHTNSRGQFFGITRRHDRAHVYRAVLEGLAFAGRRHIRQMRAAGIGFDRLVATGGGTRHPLWLAIKTGIYAEPLAVAEYPESGILGCAALAGLGAGVFADPAEAVASLVRVRPPLTPDPMLADYYARLGEIFDRLYETSGELCAQIDELTINTSL